MFNGWDLLRFFKRKKQHHVIVIRHMDDGTYRVGCSTGDIGDVSSKTLQGAEVSALATMMDDGDFKHGDTYEVEFIPQEPVPHPHYDN